MLLLYKLGIKGYALAASIAGFFSPKAKARVEGAKKSLSLLAPTPNGKVCYWMHCASVGEFEQGRPLWDRMMKQDPEARFVLSFFSPSGYEVFAPKKGVGEVAYLPWDIGTNAHDFVSQLSPKLAVFVKYEWWLGYFEALSNKQVPTVVISAAFRQNQPFFKSNVLRNDYQKALSSVAHLFVQDDSSAALLKRIGQSSFTITGDTRIDRTLSNREEDLNTPLLTAWAKQAPYVMVAGSTWIQDIKLIAKAMRANEELHIIIAPHEVDQQSLSRTTTELEEVLPDIGILFLSALEDIVLANKPHEYRVILVDSIGLLSKLYRLGDIAYIGGGFGAGIHNTLEAAVYGIPLAFGPKHDKFQEAIALVEQNIASVVANAEDLSTFVETYRNAESRKGVLAKAEHYIEKNQGATQRIWDYLIEHKLI